MTNKLRGSRPVVFYGINDATIVSRCPFALHKQGLVLKKCARDAAKAD